MNIEATVVIGQKSICKYCGNIDPKTLRRWCDLRGFPVHVHGGQWVASKTKIREWTVDRVKKDKDDKFKE